MGILLTYALADVTASLFMALNDLSSRSSAYQGAKRDTIETATSLIRSQLTELKNDIDVLNRLKAENRVHEPVYWDRLNDIDQRTEALCEQLKLTRDAINQLGDESRSNDGQMLSMVGSSLALLFGVLAGGATYRGVAGQSNVASSSSNPPPPTNGGDTVTSSPPPKPPSFSWKAAAAAVAVFMGVSWGLRKAGSFVAEKLGWGRGRREVQQAVQENLNGQIQVLSQFNQQIEAEIAAIKQNTSPYSMPGQSPAQQADAKLGQTAVQEPGSPQPPPTPTDSQQAALVATQAAQAQAAKAQQAAAGKE